MAFMCELWCVGGWAFSSILSCTLMVPPQRSTSSQMEELEGGGTAMTSRCNETFLASKTSTLFWSREPESRPYNQRCATVWTVYWGPNSCYEPLQPNKFCTSCYGANCYSQKLPWVQEGTVYTDPDSPLAMSGMGSLVLVTVTGVQTLLWCTPVKKSCRPTLF